MLCESVTCHLNRIDGSEAKRRCNKYGAAILPVAWYDLQQLWARQLPEGALQFNSSFDFSEEIDDRVFRTLAGEATHKESEFATSSSCYALAAIL